jgi:poly(3-hydroxybutyrate) depolymerase
MLFNSSFSFWGKFTFPIGLFVFPFLTLGIACKDKPNNATLNTDPAFYQVKEINYNGIKLQLVVDKPIGNHFDVLIVFHGTVSLNGNHDSTILAAAENAGKEFKSIVNNKEMLVLSVAYPQANMLFGDNITHAEAAVLWVKNKMQSEWGIMPKKLFLAGHSQGGYIVTRLNTMLHSDGVIANAPGPLNLTFRCQLEEEGKVNNGVVCDTLRKSYGTTTQNPVAYFNRSLLNFTGDFKADILFVQGLADSPIQMYSWPTFKQAILDCKTCQTVQFVEIDGAGHPALFTHEAAKTAFNLFLSLRTK